LPIIAPSLLASNFLNLQAEADMLNRSEAEWFHLDVMDGHFVPNISFGIPVIEALRKSSTKIFDVHLMIVEPEKLVPDFAKAGADSISVHMEACPNLHRNIQQIKDLGLKAGVAINPHTPAVMLENILGDVDHVLILTVNPGFGGQQFIRQSLSKIRQLRQMIDERGLDVKIEIDGGVTLENAAEIVAAGAGILVAGSSVFKAKDPLEMIAALRNIQ
jgi:ribulose-phosphate 3-epimerase